MEQAVQGRRFRHAIFRPSFVFGRDGGDPADLREARPVLARDADHRLRRAADPADLGGRRRRVLRRSRSTSMGADEPHVRARRARRRHVERVSGSSRSGCSGSGGRACTCPFGLMKRQRNGDRAASGARSRSRRDQLKMLEAGDNVVTNDDAGADVRAPARPARRAAAASRLRRAADRGAWAAGDGAAGAGSATCSASPGKERPRSASCRRRARKEPTASSASTSSSAGRGELLAPLVLSLAAATTCASSCSPRTCSSSAAATRRTCSRSGALHGFDEIVREAWEQARARRLERRDDLLVRGRRDRLVRPAARRHARRARLPPRQRLPALRRRGAAAPGLPRLVASGFPPGIAADDGVALHYVGTELTEVVTVREDATAYLVEPGSETPLPARPL